MDRLTTDRLWRSGDPPAGRRAVAVTHRDIRISPPGTSPSCRIRAAGAQEPDRIRAARCRPWFYEIPTILYVEVNIKRYGLYSVDGSSTPILAVVLYWLGVGRSPRRSSNLVGASSSSLTGSSSPRSARHPVGDQGEEVRCVDCGRSPGATVLSGRRTRPNRRPGARVLVRGVLEEEIRGAQEAGYRALRAWWGANNPEPTSASRTDRF